MIDGPWPVVPLAQLLGVRRHAGLEVVQVLGVPHAGRHRDLVVGAGLVVVEAGLEVEDRLAVLDRHDTAGREAATVTDPVDLVEDRHGRVAGAQEVGVQRMHQPVALVDRACRGDQCLSGHLSAEDPLAVLVGGGASEDVDLDRLEVEQRHQVVEGGLAGHDRFGGVVRRGLGVVSISRHVATSHPDPGLPGSARPCRGIRHVPSQFQGMVGVAVGTWPTPTVAP